MMSSNLYRSTPTVAAKKEFKAEEAAKALRDAMKGLGTNEKAIIEILTGHTSKQRLEMVVKYKEMFNRDLTSDLASDLGGNFNNTVQALMMYPQAYMAREVQRSIKGVGTDEELLIEIICGRSNDDIKALKEAYKKEIGKDLTEQVQSDVCGDFRWLLTSLLKAEREQESETVETQKASADAIELHKAGVEFLGTDEDMFTWILTKRSFSHLRAVFEVYKQHAGHDIEKAIKGETSGDLRKGYLALVNYAKNPALFYAERLYAAMKGLGTSDLDLIRIIVGRSEIDLGDVAAAFKAKYGKTLASFIQSDCSGDYKRILLAILGA